MRSQSCLYIIAGLLAVFVAAQFVSPLAVVLLFNITNLFHYGRMDFNVLSSPSALGVSLLLSSALVWAVLTLAGWTDGRSFRPHGVRKTTYLWVVLCMIPVIFIVNLLLEAFPLEDTNQELFTKLAYNPWGVTAIMLLGPFAEELVFRMGIQRQLMRYGLSPQRAILSSALVFSVVHLNPAQVPGAFLFGLVLGWLYWRSGSIWASLAAHVCNNVLGVALIWLSGDNDTTLVELCGGVALAMVLVLPALAWIYTGYKYLDKAWPNSDEPSTQLPEA